MADNKVIYAKCPYCKNLFPWISGFLGEYPSSYLDKKCSNCGNISRITATQTIKFTAKKIGGEER